MLHRRVKFTPLPLSLANRVLFMLHAEQGDQRVLPYFRFLLSYFVLGLGAIPVVVVLALFLPFRTRRIRLTLAMSRYLARASMFCIGVRPLFVGPQPSSLAPAIYLANHSSTMDVFLFAISAPVGSSVLIKKEMVFVPIIGQIAWLSGCLRVDRKNPSRAKESLRKGAEMLKAEGLSVFVMPEGTRSREGSLQPFKKGFVHLAIATGLPIVPLVFHNAAKLWPMGSWKVTAGEVVIEVLQPISSKDWTAASAGNIAEDVRSVFAEALERREV